MISLYDLTPYQFLLLVMHIISGMLYTVLGIKIIQLKKYLKWNRHIYPRMMIASFGLALVFLSSLVSREEYNIFFHLFMWLFAFNQFSELFRLVDKYNTIQDLENKINMKNTVLIFVIGCLTLSGCGSRKVDLEKQIQTNKSQTESYEKKVSELKEQIVAKESTTKELTSQLNTKTTEVEKLKSERKELQEKLNQESQDDFNIKDAVGTVKVTDSKGNTYEIPSGQGTEIIKTSMSKIQQEKKTVENRLEKSLQTEQVLAQTIIERNNSIKELNSQIDSKTTEIKDLETQISNKNTEINRLTEREAYPVWLWLLVGAIVGVILVEFIKKQNPFNIFKKQT